MLMQSQQSITVFYDLTETMLGLARRISHYGIGRVATELGTELFRARTPCRFVVFSFGHGKFFEVTPTLELDGSVRLNVPAGVEQDRVRTYFGKNRISPWFGRLANLHLARKSRQNWERLASDLPEVNMDGGTLVTATRPKLVIDMIQAMDRLGQAVDIVPLLHDFMPLHHAKDRRSKSFDRHFMLDNQRLIEKSRLVMTISNFTAHELIRFAEEGLLPHPQKAVVVPLVHECAPGTDAPSITIPSEPYILTVGSSLGRKNFEIVTAALLHLKTSGRPVPRLVVAGAPRRRMMRHIDSSSLTAIRDRIDVAANPHQTDLVRLYQNALALILPSRIEGWGLPAGEALWCGTPAICSTAPVLREVCGDLGLYFDPDDPTALAEILAGLLTDPQSHALLKARIREAKPSLRQWSNVATDLTHVLVDLGVIPARVAS